MDAVSARDGTCGYANVAVLKPRTNQPSKCDETQPVCSNCGAAEIRCSFLEKSVPYIISADPSIRDDAAVSSTVPSSASTPAQTTPQGTNGNVIEGFSVNMTHMALFNNLFSNDFLDYEKSNQPDIIPTSIYMRCALMTPYLMHQLLATSAFNLSIRIPESRSFYQDYATGLQNRALTLFKESHPTLQATEANCVQMFLFSSLVGVHLVCDTLQHRRTSLKDFIENFTSSLGVYRGVLAVIEQCRHLLRMTELEPRLKMTQEIFRSPTTNGSECDTLRKMLDTADLTPSARKGYKESIFRLQQIFDGQRAPSGDIDRRPAVFLWPIHLSAHYVDLLRQHKAEALIILAHYAILLHRSRDLWLIGESGRFLIGSITEGLGPNWREYLQFPNSALREEVAG